MTPADESLPEVSFSRYARAVGDGQRWCEACRAFIRPMGSPSVQGVPCTQTPSSPHLHYAAGDARRIPLFRLVSVETRRPKVLP